MFIGLIAQGDPFWLVWFVLQDIAFLSLLYGTGVLLFVVDGRYYGATNSKARKKVGNENSK